MMTDPIADLLVRLRNGAQRAHDSVLVPASRLKRGILRVLKTEGYIRDYAEELVDGHPHLRVWMRYVAEGQPMINTLRRVSKPGLRVYVGKREVQPVRGGLGIAVLSNSSGVMTDRESRAAGVGGEVLFQVW